jgi:proteasome lid subunit RPN8/RPN11
MRRTSVVIALVLCCGTAAAAPLDIGKTIDALPLLLGAAGADREAERAAFILELPDGTYECRLWPRTNQRFGSTWHGAIPERTIAIAHTHPVTMPQPSRVDVGEAVRLGIPFIIVSRTHIFLIGETGEVTQLESAGWLKRRAHARRD